MTSTEIREFAASMEVPFGKPVAFAPPVLDDSISKLTAALGFPIGTEKIRVRLVDALYNYELRAEFYGGSGIFARTADRLFLTLSSGRSLDDAKFIIGLIGNFGDQFLRETKLRPIIRVYAHLGVGSTEARDAYLSRFRVGPEVVHPGTLGHVTVKETDTTVKITIEPSFSHPDAIFLTAEAEFPPSDDWNSYIVSAIETLRKAACVYGVEVSNPV
jgi:hypothetical protein